MTRDDFLAVLNAKPRGALNIAQWPPDDDDVVHVVVHNPRTKRQLSIDIPADGPAYVLRIDRRLDLSDEYIDPAGLASELRWVRDEAAIRNARG